MPTKIVASGVILDRQSKVLRRGKDLLNALPQCDEVEIVVSASMVGFIPAQLPPGSQNKILGALAFLVEAGLISTPEDTHALLAEQSVSHVIVAVIQKSWMKRLLEKLSRANIFPSRMFPETLLPELPQNGWAMVCRDHDSFIRTSIVHGIPIDVDPHHHSPPFLLTLALQQCEPENRPSSISMYGERITHANDWEAHLNLSLVRPVQQEWFLSPIKPSFNLLQGEFQPSGGISRRLTPFKPLLITLGALFTLQLSMTLLDYALKISENRKLDQAILNQFKAAFPNANSVVNAPLQMQRNLDELRHHTGQSGNTDFISLLSDVTNSIGAVSVERLSGMEYQNNKLILSLLSPDMEQAEAMRKHLIDSGLSATLEVVRKTNMGLDYHLLVSANSI